MIRVGHTKCKIPIAPVSVIAIAITGQSPSLIRDGCFCFHLPELLPAPCPWSCSSADSISGIPWKGSRLGTSGTEQPPASLQLGLFALICSPFLCLSHQRQEHQIRNKVVNSLSKYRGKSSFYFFQIRASLAPPASHAAAAHASPSQPICADP